jgi:hypothetical protein
MSGLKRPLIVRSINRKNPAASICGDKICVSYYDETNQNLRFAEGNIGNWEAFTVDALKCERGRDEQYCREE